MRISVWIILIISFLVKETFSIPIPNQVTLGTKKRGEDKNFTLVVNECVWLEQKGIDGVLVSIKHHDNCIEVHQNAECDGDFVVAKRGVPATVDLYRWNLNGTRPWIDLEEGQGAKAVRPCRDKCDPAKLVFPKGDQVVHNVSFYSEIGFQGTNENVTIKGCQVIPKPLRNNVASLLTDGSFCIELYETRNCAGVSVEIPRKVPWHLTRDLETNWKDSYISRKTVAVSLCGYNCPHSGLKVETTPAEPEQLPQDQLALTLYIEPHFQGAKLKVNLTGVECYKVAISSPLRIVKYESMDTHEGCFNLFEKDGECNREKGNFITVSNWEEGSDLVLRGLTGGIKSIAPCPPKKNLFLLLLSLFLMAILVFAIVIVAIYIKRKRDKSPEQIPKQKDNLNTPGSNHYSEPLVPQVNQNGREDTGGSESVALLPNGAQFVPEPLNIPRAAEVVSPEPTVVDPAPSAPIKEIPGPSAPTKEEPAGPTAPTMEIPGPAVAVVNPIRGVRTCSREIHCKSSRINALVTFMIRNQVLLNNWSQLTDVMNLNAQDKIQWERGFNNSNLRPYNLFTEILQNWVSSNSKRTVRHLVLILEEINCRDVAEGLKEDLEMEDVIR